MKRSLCLCAAISAWLAAPLAAQLAPVEPDPISLEQIMADPDWLGRAPEGGYWSADGDSVLFERKQQGSPERRLYRVGLDGGPAVELSEPERSAADGAEGDWSDDRLRSVDVRHGDLFLRELGSGELRQLTRTAQDERAPQFLLGGRAVSFLRGGELFVRELDSGLEYQPAVLRFEKDPEAPPDPDYRRDQQQRLLQWVRERDAETRAERERERRASEQDASRSPSPVYLGDEVELRGASLSPDARWLLLVLIPSQREQGRRDSMPRFVTEDAYVEPEPVRALVGTGQAASDRLLLLDLRERTRHELPWDALPGLDADPLAEQRRAAAARRAAADALAAKPDAPAPSEPDQTPAARVVRVGSGGLDGGALDGVFWSDDAERLLLQVFSADHKDRWLVEVDLAAPALAARVRLTDPAWINWDHNQVGFVPGTRDVWFTSEASGWSQLYRLNAAGEPERLTRGESVVRDVTPSPDGRHLYYTANPGDPGVYETWRYDLAAQRAEAVTALGGRNDYALSPDGSRLLLLHSETVRPPELYLQDARPEAAARRLTATTSELFLSLPWVAPERVAVPSTHHQRPIHARVYDAGGAGPRPAVVFIHGAGYLQNADAGWSGYFREFMFHTLLARRGYVVLDMDYRASQGYGRDWRTAIYRQMGTPELEDLADGVRWLVAERGVDPARVGAYGGSYGGFLTLMALFRQPGLFAAGAALRPVTDWAHYNDGYTSRILNTPELDPDAYQRSSPLEFAEGLERPLLIAHGMVDDNVFYKDSVRLAQRLIELEKTGWELASYPVEPHGFREPSSWLDEYRRILALFERHLR